VPALTILALRLSHFRNHEALQLRFDGRPVAITGPNGAGKTNILEAVSLLSPGRGLRRAGSDEIARQPGTLGWKVAARVAGIGGSEHEIELWAMPGGPRQLRIDGKAAAQIALAGILRVLWLVPAMDRLWIEAAEGRRRFLDRVTMSFLPDHAQAAIDYERAMRERNRLLRQGEGDRRWYAALEERMAEAAAALIGNRAQALARLMEAQAAAPGPFPRASLAIRDAEGEVPEPAALPALWAGGRARDMAAGRTLAGPHRSDLHATLAGTGQAAAQCSTGEQKALLISLILANARALRDDLGRAPVLLLDEVAAHLDAGRRAALYDEIAVLGAQALMTGTEGSLFAPIAGAAQAVTLDRGDAAPAGARNPAPDPPAPGG